MKKFLNQIVHGDCMQLLPELPDDFCHLILTSLLYFVLDSFMGSGTTAIACIEANRNYIGFEINEDYYKDSIQRIQSLQKNLFDVV